jgi:hypothetical protein
MYDAKISPLHAYTEYMMAALSSFDNKVYMIQQKIMKQQLTVMDM